MSEEFRRLLSRILDDRVHQIAWHEAKKDSDYLEAIENMKEYEGILYEDLDKNQQRLLNTFVELMNLNFHVYLEYAYLQGLKDSAIVSEFINN